MKDDKREILYRFRANKAESSMIEARYIQSSCSSISEFFRQIVINDMIVQNSEEELKNLNEMIQQRDKSNSEYKAVNSELKDIDYARQAIDDYLKTQDVSQEQKRKKGDLE